MKEKMITRTFPRTNFDMMQVDTTTCEVRVTEETLDTNFKTEEDLLKRCKKLFEDETLKIVKVQITSTEEILIGMSLSDFYKYGKILPPRLESQRNHKQED